MLLFNCDLDGAIYLGAVYFNTSNITIQRSKNTLQNFNKVYFNTSNVTIQPGLLSNIRRLLPFQYI